MCEQNRLKVGPHTKTILSFVFPLISLLLANLPCLSLTPADPCLLFFTVQPPLSIPCNPYQQALGTSAQLSLQCTVHAPRLSLHLMERNFTVEWVRVADSPRAPEEIIGEISLRNGVHLENVHETYFYSHSASFVGAYVTSVLTFDLAKIPRDNLTGKYWCRVLVKSLNNYSYTFAGRSNTETTIPGSAEYLSNNELVLFPPCVSETIFYQPSFKCVHDTGMIHVTSLEFGVTSDMPMGGTVTMPTGALAAVAIVGGALIVTVMILLLIVIYSCRVVNARKGSGKNSLTM